MKENIKNVFWIGFILFLLVSLARGIDLMRRDEERERQKIQQFMEDCISKRGRIEQVGSWWSSTYLVCYSKGE